jgi:hypothetical protein
MTSMTTRLSPDEWAAVGVDYCAKKMSVAAIADKHNTTPRSVYYAKCRFGWPDRRAGRAVSRKLRPRMSAASVLAASAPVPAAMPPPSTPAGTRRRRRGDTDLRRHVARLHRFVAERLEAIVSDADQDPAGVDRRAAFLTRTMVQLDGLNTALKRRAQQEKDRDVPEPSRSINVLRDELCRRLARLRDAARGGTLGPRSVRGGDRNDPQPLADPRGPGGPAPADGPTSS